MRMNDTHDAAHAPDKPQYYWSTFKEQHRDWLFGSWTKRPEPGIKPAIDTPSDQGGKVIVRWAASGP